MTAVQFAPWLARIELYVRVNDCRLDRSSSESCPSTVQVMYRDELVVAVAATPDECGCVAHTEVGIVNIGDSRHVKLVGWTLEPRNFRRIHSGSEH